MFLSACVCACLKVIESQAKRNSQDRGEVAPVRSATLNIIDLAGSESVRLANTTGQSLEEGKFINRSLLTLGHIIWKLSRDRHRTGLGGVRAPSTPHLPYRSSKLTRILQPSLGGQAQIAIVCTASPSVECLAETHNTLKFASRARRVRNRVVVNENLGESALLRKYRARIRELEEQLHHLQMRRRPRESAQMISSNQTALNDRQMELKFAINNINRVILNSSQAQERPDEEELASVDEDTFPAMATPLALESPHPLPSTIQTTRRGEYATGQTQRKPTPKQPAARQQAEVELQAPQTQSRAATRPLLRQKPVHSTSSVSLNRPEEGKNEGHPRSRLARSGSSANTSSKTLIGSGGSASTKTLPLSSSSSRHLTDNDDVAETKEEHDEDEGEKGDEPEREANVLHDAPTHPEATDEEAPIAPNPMPPASSSSARPSLTSMLKTKYLNELSKMDQRAGRWQHTDEGELFKQKELLREFVRGLEIALAEQETRMSKIRELELENLRLHQAVASRDDELSHLRIKTTRQTLDA